MISTQGNLLRSQNSNAERPLMMLSTIVARAKIANLTQAILHREETSMRRVDEYQDYVQYSICGTSLQVFGRYGIGLQLYFLFVKQITMLFFLLSVLSIYAMMNNYVGNGFKGIFAKQKLTYFTLANQQGVSSFETDLEAAEKVIPLCEKNLERLWIVDFIMSFMFLGFILSYAWLSKKTILQTEGKNFTITDFAIEAEGFPPGISSEEVHEYFSVYGDIAEIYLSRIYEGKLPKYKKIYEMANEIGVEKKSGNRRSSRRMSGTINIFDNKIVLDKTHDELDIDKVFVVFETIKAKQNCLEDNRVKHFSNLFYGKKSITRATNYKVKTTNPLNPSDILWENMEYTYFDLLKVRIPIFILTITIILLSFMIIYVIKSYYNSIPTNDDCKKILIPEMGINSAQNVLKSQKEIDCYCKQQNLDNLISDSRLADYCSNYIESYYTLSLINFTVSFCIVIVNYILRIVIGILSKYERFRGKTEKQNYILGSMFLLTFFNTALTTLLVNSDLGSSMFGLKGKYSDITREWYDDVGYTITVTMAVSIFSPHLVNLFLLYPIGIIKRKLFYRCFKSQYKLNKFFRGPRFEISHNIAQILVVIFTSYFYSSGMPFLNMICFVALFICYWCNKILILRHYRTPPIYSYNLNTRIIYLLPFIVVFHCCFSAIVYGSSEIFPSSFKIDDETGFVVPEKVGILERFAKNPGIANIFILGLCLIVIAALRNFNKIFVRFSEYTKVSNVNNDKKTFTELKEAGLLNGLSTYNIYENPKYKYLILALDSVAKKHKRIIHKIDINMNDEEDEEGSPPVTDHQNIDVCFKPSPRIKSNSPIIEFPYSEENYT
ncbi:hypothetical protein SteCoe_6064 [Stentor coeruleus]|uniref:CSC1/OSCA1-like cytosolic domain-containing protein n=1 Tax=Stentor coeruleus TaxID=5963 RepID=A0A1R2CQU6_9CILI|nr:hypothetical protein SteCoe_6064 [Stentor coeruleus]